MEFNFNLSSLKIIEQPLTNSLNCTIERLECLDLNNNDAVFLQIEDERKNIIKAINVLRITQIKNPVIILEKIVKAIDFFINQDNAVDLIKNNVQLFVSAIKTTISYIQSLVIGGGNDYREVLHTFKMLQITEENHDELIKISLLPKKITDELVCDKNKSKDVPLAKSIYELKQEIAFCKEDSSINGLLRVASFIKDGLLLVEKLKQKTNIGIYEKLLNLYLAELSIGVKDKDIANNTYVDFNIICEDFVSFLEELNTILGKNNNGNNITFCISNDWVNTLVLGILRIKEFKNFRAVYDILGLDKDIFDLKLLQDCLLDKEKKVNPYSNKKSNIDKNLITKLCDEILSEASFLFGKKIKSTDFLNGNIIKITNLINNLSEILKQNTEFKVFLDKIANGFNALLQQKDGTPSKELEKELAVGLIFAELGVRDFVLGNPDEESTSHFFSQLELISGRLDVAVAYNFIELKKYDLPKLNTYSQEFLYRKAITALSENILSIINTIEDGISTLISYDVDTTNENDLVVSVISLIKDLINIFSVTGAKPIAYEIELLKSWLEKKHIENNLIPSISKNKSCFKIIGLTYLYVNALKNEDYFLAKDILSMFSNVGIFTQDKKKEEKLNVVLEKEDVTKTIRVKDVFFIEKDVEDSEIRALFFEEAKEIIAKIASETKELSSGSANMEVLKNIRRYYHTLKGSARMAELSFFGEATWIIEQVLNKSLRESDCIKGEVVEFLEWANKFIENTLFKLDRNIKHEIDLVAIKTKAITICPEIQSNIEIQVNFLDNNQVVNHITQNSPIIEKNESDVYLNNLLNKEKQEKIEKLKSHIRNNEYFVDNVFLVYIHTILSMLKIEGYNTFIPNEILEIFLRLESIAQFNQDRPLLAKGELKEIKDITLHILGSSNFEKLDKNKLQEILHDINTIQNKFSQIDNKSNSNLEKKSEDIIQLSPQFSLDFEKNILESIEKRFDKLFDSIKDTINSQIEQSIERNIGTIKNIILDFKNEQTSRDDEKTSKDDLISQHVNLQMNKITEKIVNAVVTELRETQAQEGTINTHSVDSGKTNGLPIDKVNAIFNDGVNKINTLIERQNNEQSEIISNKLIEILNKKQVLNHEYFNLDKSMGISNENQIALGELSILLQEIREQTQKNAEANKKYHNIIFNAVKKNQMSETHIDENKKTKSANSIFNLFGLLK